jgi:hypothetical protein
MAPITREEAVAYVERWRAVLEVEREELAKLTPEDRLRILEALARAARESGWVESLRAEDEIVRERWRRLKERLVG